MSAAPPVSIGLPIRNGQDSVVAVARSVLAQDHPDLELVICDNASTDDTEAICRELAAADPRVVYHRRSRNVGLLANFVGAMELARGRWFRWIGDGDTLAPQYVSRCLDAFAADDRLILVTTQLDYFLADGTVGSGRYDGVALASDDPVDRFAEMLRLCTAGYTVLDPLYGMVRRDRVRPLPRRNMLREDQVFAARMALAGPWGHVPETLARRGWDYEPLPSLARKLGVPGWQARLATAIQCRELLAALPEFDLDPAQQRRARAEVARFAGRKVADKGRRARRKLQPSPSA